MAERICFPRASKEPVTSKAPEEHAGESRWRNGSGDSWWLTVLVKGDCAHACVRRRSSGRWSGFVSCAHRRGWQHEDGIDAGESLLEAMRTAERAIARLSASAW